MVCSRVENKKLRRSISWRWLALVIAHLCAILLWPILYFSGVSGHGTIDFIYLYAAVHSAVLYYGSDFFKGSQLRRYANNLALHLAIGFVAGLVFHTFGPEDMFYDNGTCVPFGASARFLFVGTTLYLMIPRSSLRDFGLHCAGSRT